MNKVQSGGLFSQILIVRAYKNCITLIGTKNDLDQ